MNRKNMTLKLNVILQTFEIGAMLEQDMVLGKKHKICKYVNVSFYKYCKCHTWKPFANIHELFSKFYLAFSLHFIALDAIKVNIVFAFTHNTKCI